ncbi:DMT family transporter [Bosea sp. 2KB_26]|uniref:DMT family transporter n=1 Tax=Bosea sp. 2KB_26 TaxID=3237475 RepID=UPI003F91A54F
MTHHSTSLNDRSKGTFLVLAATICWSASGLYSRLLTTDVWTAIGWRSLFAGLFLIGPLLFLGGGLSRQHWRTVLQPAGLAMIACQTISQASFIGAYYTTSVANVAAIYATAPFIAALLGWLLLKERASWRTLATGLVCLIGVGIIMASSIGGGRVVGDLLALVMTASFAMVIVLPRLNPDLPALPPIIVSALLTFVLFAPFGSAGSLDIHNWVVLAAFGATNFSIALVLFIMGARHLPPAEAALIGTTEIVMTPLWVWLLLAEEPPLATVIGGAVIFAAVVCHTAVELTRNRGLSRS